MKAKKQIKKLEHRIERIEKELARNSSFTMSKDVLRSITEPKLPVEEKPFVLPEKWCVRSDEQEFVDYCNRFGVHKGLYKKSELIDNYAHFPSFRYAGALCTTSIGIKKGYTEITFEQFKQHVLKQKLTLADIQVNVEDCSGEEIKELADIFVVNGFHILFGSETLSKNNNEHYLFGFGGYLAVYTESKELTTLTPSQFREMFGKKEIDWSIGQYVKNSKGSVWLVMKDVDKTYFKGVMLLNEGKEDILYATKILKRDMTLCTEPITLNN